VLFNIYVDVLNSNITIKTTDWLISWIH